MDALKGLGTVLLVLAVFVGLAVVGYGLIEGTAWISLYILPFVNWLMVLAFALCVLVLPLALVPPLRSLVAYVYFVSSYVFGVDTWICGFLVTYVLWGGWALILGLILGVVGVVPLGILAALFKAEWWWVANLVMGLVLTYATRAFSLYLILKAEERNARVLSVS